MGKVYFGFGLADNMFPVDCSIHRQELTVEQVKTVLDSHVVEFCLNPSHVATIEVARQRFGLKIEVPKKAPVVKLAEGDFLLCMAVSGLPRLEERHEYSAEEVGGATFRFALWEVEKRTVRPPIFSLLAVPCWNCHFDRLTSEDRVCVMCNADL